MISELNATYHEKKQGISETKISRIIYAFVLILLFITTM